MNDAPRVIVVGAGWAGLATAIELSRHNIPVTVLEAAKQPGGRARCVAFGAERVDNGQHLMIGAYRETLRLLSLIHADDPPLHRETLHLDVRTASHALSLTAPNLPAPLHLIAALLRAEGLSVGDRWRALRFCLALALTGFRLDRDQSVAQLLAAHHQSNDITATLWEPLCLATLNTHIRDASAQVFLTVLRDAFARRRVDSDLVFSTVDLGNFFPSRAVDFIEQHGGDVMLGARVSALIADDARVTGVRVGEQIHATQHIVIATAANAAQALLAPIPPMTSTAAQLAQLNYEPICTIYLRYPAHVTLGRSMIGLCGGLAQWIVDRSLTDQPGLMAVVISGNGSHMDLDNAALTQRVQQELKSHFPAWPEPHETFVMREKRATFACSVGINARRPRCATKIAGLWLAGDFTDTGYPATLEGAVRSGVECARKIISMHST